MLLFIVCNIFVNGFTVCTVHSRNDRTQGAHTHTHRQTHNFECQHRAPDHTMDSIICAGKIDFIHIFQRCTSVRVFALHFGCFTRWIYCCRWLLFFRFSVGSAEKSSSLHMFFFSLCCLNNLFSFFYYYNNSQQHPAEVCGIWFLYRNLYERIFLNLMWIEDEREFYYMQNQCVCIFFCWLCALWCIFVCADRMTVKGKLAYMRQINKQTSISTNLMRLRYREPSVNTHTYIDSFMEGEKKC